jgi:beta-galactosidase/beta-glucuronidase
MKYLLNRLSYYKVDLDNKGINNGWWVPSWIEENKSTLGRIELPNCWNSIPSLEKFEGIVWFFIEFDNIPGYSNISNRSRIFDLYLHFKGANYNSTVWLNGVKLGTHDYGFLPFEFNVIADTINTEGNNYIAVRVENFRKKNRIPCKSFDWYNYGGIYRDIEFHIREKYRIDWIGVSSEVDENSNANIQVKIRISDNRENITTVEEMMHHITWNLYYVGNLSSKKDVNQEIIEDREESSGSLDADVITNDEADIIDDFLSESTHEVAPPQIATEAPQEPGVLIKSGENRFVGEKKNNFEFFLEKPKLWNPYHPELYRLEISLMGSKERKNTHFGIRSIRSTKNGLFLNNKRIKLYGVSLHEEQVPYYRTISLDMRRQDILAIKRLGFNALRTAHYPHDESLIELADREGLLILEEIPVYWGIAFSDPDVFRTAADMIRTLIFRDYNHPSVIMWSCGNEIPVNNLTCARFIKNLMKYARTLDSSRLISYVSMTMFTDRVRKKSDINCINTYFGWYYLAHRSVGFLLDTIRYTNPKKHWILTEFGAGAKLGFHKPLRAAYKFSEEYQASVISHHIQTMNSRDYFAGWFIWIYRDFKSHLRLNPYQSGFNRKGIVDEYNNKKLIAKILPKIIRKHNPNIRNHNLFAAMFLGIIYPIAKLVGLLISFFQPQHGVKEADEFYMIETEKK